jgi:hypothetical protein
MLKLKDPSTRSPPIALMVHNDWMVLVNSVVNLLEVLVNPHQKRVFQERLQTQMRSPLIATSPDDIGAAVFHVDPNSECSH